MSLPESDRSWREQCQSNVGHQPMVDVTDMIRRGESVCGAASLASLQRLAQDLPDQPTVVDFTGRAGAQDLDQAGVGWYELSGSSQTGRRDRVWLKIQAIVTLTCQRCMKPMQFVVDETAAFVCYANETEALAAVQDDDDPLAPEPLAVDEPLDLIDLVQDQLILAVPYVPKHEACEPAVQSAGEPIEDEPRESPFKVLEGLKTKPGKQD